MNRDEFKELFEAELEKAVVAQEEIQGRELPRNFDIEFSGQGISREIIDVDLATDLLYLGENEFLSLVDMMVIAANSKVTRVFISVTGRPSKPTFEETWNHPPGSGPFKQVIFTQFRILPE
jgi:hypothetical protein